MESPNFVEIKFSDYLVLLDKFGEAIKVQLADVGEFVKRIELELAIDEYLRSDPRDMNSFRAIKELLQP